LRVGVPKEIAASERRVALVPDGVKTVCKAGLEVVVETGAGVEAGFPDAEYVEAGAQIVSTATEALGADIVLKVMPPQQTSEGGHEVDSLREGAVLIGFLDPLEQPKLAEQLAKHRTSAFAIELVPRVSRAQSMDGLSSQSTISGYRAVVLAAASLPRIFPMLVTAAGTLQPAKVLVIGAGVAGLQALGSAKRLGAITSAYDTRAAVREQVESVGARFVELDLVTGESEDSGGYATAQNEEFYQKQREELGKHVAASDVVITTALVPGQPAPFLIEESAVAGMRAGSVVVDLAAAKGGNCACTEADRVIQAHGVTIIGHTNLPAQIPNHASQMYARNLTTFLAHLVQEGELQIDLEDEITAGSLLAHDGAVTNERVRQLLGAATPETES
jgi:NAD(P) transhydrogenase subunit alpha